MNWHSAHTFSSFHPIYFHKLMCSMKCMVFNHLGVFGVIIYKYMYIFVCKCTSICVNLLPSKFSPESPICMIRSFFSRWQVQYESLTEAVRLLGCFSDAVDIQPLFDTNIQDDEVKGQGESLDAEVDLSRGVWEDFFWKSPENQWDFFSFCHIQWHYSEIGS